MNCMQSNVTNKNRFRWPAAEDTMSYADDEILCKIEPPSPLSSGILWRGDYCLSEKNFKEVTKLLKDKKK